MATYFPFFSQFAVGDLIVVVVILVLFWLVARSAANRQVELFRLGYDHNFQNLTDKLTDLLPILIANTQDQVPKKLLRNIREGEQKLKRLREELRWIKIAVRVPGLRPDGYTYFASVKISTDGTLCPGDAVIIGLSDTDMKSQQFDYWWKQTWLQAGVVDVPQYSGEYFVNVPHWEGIQNNPNKIVLFDTGHTIFRRSL